MSLKKVYIVEDNPFELDWLSERVAQLFPQLDVNTFSCPLNFKRALRSKISQDSIFIIDLQFKGQKISGFDLINEVRQQEENAFIIVRTHLQKNEHILKAVHLNADAICRKGIDDEFLGKAIECAINRSQNDSQKIPDYIFKSQSIISWLERIPNILTSAISNIHIHGPSGSGKEVYTDVLASQLPDDTPFIRINCAAISESVLESEFFGHVKGSFTGALRDRKGYFALADGGWLFLDEVSCLTSTMQSSLLRVIESGEYLPVGSSKVHKTDIKIISATNDELTKKVDEGNFREDLRQRLCDLHIQLPGIDNSKSEFANLVSHICKTLTWWTLSKLRKARLPYFVKLISPLANTAN